MIVDSSALVAIVKRQPEREACLQILVDEPFLSMSSATYVEVAMVMDNLPVAFPFDPLERMLERFNIILVPVSPELARIARQAHQRYGRGKHSRAKLNFGDCFAYALARERNEPLLFVGDDFTHTDIASALG